MTGCDKVRLCYNENNCSVGKLYNQHQKNFTSKKSRKTTFSINSHYYLL